MHIHILPSVVEPLRSEVTKSHVENTGCEIAQKPEDASFVIGYGSKAADWPPGIPAEKKIILFNNLDDRKGNSIPLNAHVCIAGDGRWKVGTGYPIPTLSEFLTEKAGATPKA